MNSLTTSTPWIDGECIEYTGNHCPIKNKSKNHWFSIAYEFLLKILQKLWCESSIHVKCVYIYILCGITHVDAMCHKWDYNHSFYHLRSFIIWNILHLYFFSPKEIDHTTWQNFKIRISLYTRHWYFYWSNNQSTTFCIEKAQLLSPHR